MDRSDLGDRMKGYEAAGTRQLPPDQPVVIRIDGKSFHTYTRGFKRPFDLFLREAMIEATKALCEQAQGARLGYTQSDEISVVLSRSALSSQTWFQNKLQKLVSVSASIVTGIFNNYIGHDEHRGAAAFDARAWSLPVDEVENYFIWRQADAKRNAVSAYAHHKFGHKALQGKNVPTMIDMIGPDWLEQLGDSNYYGTYVLHRQYKKQAPDGSEVLRSRWTTRVQNLLEDRTFVDRELP